jgi:Ca2+ transporting ATPase
MIAALLVILMAGEYFIPEDCYSEEYEGKYYSYCTPDGYVRSGRRFNYDRTEATPEDNMLYAKDVHRALGPSRHLAVLSNLFVFLQLFNQINCRKLTNELDVFSGIFTNYITAIVFATEVGLQIIIAEFGREVFSMHDRV